VNIKQSKNKFFANIQTK